MANKKLLATKAGLNRLTVVPHLTAVITTQPRTYMRNTEVCSRDHCYRGKAMNITYSECVSVALVIQRTKRMRRSILSSVACLSVPLTRKRYDFLGVGAGEGGGWLDVKYMF